VAAEKVIVRGRELAGAKARMIFAGFIGTTEVVPLLQSSSACALASFSATCVDPDH
jgi:hypothetical protein